VSKKERQIASDQMCGLPRRGEQNTNIINKTEFDKKQPLKNGVGSKWGRFNQVTLS
jgi:hypothetical protein